MRISDWSSDVSLPICWTPKVLDDAGLPTRLALLAGTFTSIFSILGNLSMGYFSAIVSAARLPAIYFAGAATSILLFGLNPGEPYTMMTMAPVISSSEVHMSKLQSLIRNPYTVYIF